MSLSTDPLDELQIPDETTVEEHDLVTDGDVILGARSTVTFGVRGRNVLAGEGVEFGGDIGDDVEIDEGFEANGWIVIRNPMPTVVFLFVYLSQLLRIGETETARQLVEQIKEEEAPERDPVVIPRSATVDDETWRVSTPATIGDDCRLHGNVRAESIDVGEDNNVFGSLRARGDIVVGEGTRIHGDVSTRKGEVRIAPGAEVLGDIACENLSLHDDAAVDGSIRARGEMSIRKEFARELE